jgi:hypothetical protein
MEFIKEKFFYWGLIAGSLWIAFGVLVLVFILSEAPLEESLIYLYQKKQLGGLISLAALINLPVKLPFCCRHSCYFISNCFTYSILESLFLTILIGEILPHIWRSLRRLAWSSSH